MKSFRQIRAEIMATGVGYAGLDGCWWLPARDPFVLPASMHTDLQVVGSAMFVLLDAMAELWDQSAELRQGLTHKVPSSLRSTMSHARVQFLRPDFQLVVDPTSRSGLGIIATELEICPSAQGYAHAMQVAYGLKTDLVDTMASYLEGRRLAFIGTHAWSAFLFEQLAFCRALAERGAHGTVIYDLPIAQIAEEVQRGKRWQLPLFGIHSLPAHWDTDIQTRITKHGLKTYLQPEDGVWPQDWENTILFRFGYLHNFSPEKLSHFERWQQAQTLFLNPPTFWLDNKVLMAVISLPDVRRHLLDRNPETLHTLERCLPETQLLTPNLRSQLLAEREEWLLKYAGFDDTERAWGGGSVTLGTRRSPTMWRRLIDDCMELPWPVVAQRYVPSIRTTIPYWADDGSERYLIDGNSRLRAFFLRERTGCAVLGTHLTVSADNSRVAEGLKSVQAPVVFD